MNYAAFLGVEVINVAKGTAHVKAEVTRDHLNMHKTAHGGFLYSLADEALGLASNSQGDAAVAISIHMEYFKAAREGDIIEAIASEIYNGRRTASYRIELLRAAQCIAIFQGMVYKPGSAAD